MRSDNRRAFKSRQPQAENDGETKQAQNIISGTLGTNFGNFGNEFRELCD
jgi:hypothetical protein